MLGLGDVKKVEAKINIYLSFVPILLQYFFVEWIEFVQTGNLLFDKRQLLLDDKFCKIEYIGIVDWCGLGKDLNFQKWQHFYFKQSD